MTARALLLVGLVLAPAAGAQTLARRVAQAADGVVRFSFAHRPGVCGDGGSSICTDCAGGRCGRRMQVTGHGTNWDDDWVGICDSGPARVALEVRGGAVRDLHVYVGGSFRPASAGVTDLGTAGASDVEAFLVQLARGGTDAGRQALFALTIVDSITAWPDLLKLAKDQNLGHDTRRSAVFWLSQAAGEAATRGLDSLAGDETEDREVRGQAVFALSQRPRDEGIPALVRIARENKDPEIRKKAIFWLGQSDDPRALALFEELLTKP
ncbi:MAG TPA: HEAT repeat domain-containing protein [Gemmatimonadales bacterium]|nr:HEAT repeat domain-containing protein [Gemmatimonadales bacterium]